MTARTKDIVAGAFLMAFSVFNLIVSRTISSSSMSILSSAVFPRVCLSCLGLIGLGILVRGVRRPKTKECNEKNSAYLRVLFVFLILIGCVALMPLIGFIPVGMIFLFSNGLLLMAHSPEKKDYLVLAAVSVVTTVVVYFLFTGVFELMLPSGSIWG